MDHEVVRALKLLTDADRLRLCAELAARPAPAEGLAAALGLPLRAVARNLRLLESEGLVDRLPGPAYRLRIARLGELGRALDELSQVPGQAEDPGSLGAGPPASAAEQKVLRAFLVEGRLTSIPAQHSKRLVLLRYIAERTFQEPRGYPEKEVNQLLAHFQPDVASLRRYLVDEHFMAREGGVYRLRPVEDWPPRDRQD